MQVQVLYGGALRSPQELHQLLARRLRLPDYYGVNLDALWDCLSERSQPLELILYEEEKLLQTLPDFGPRFLRLLEEAQEEGPGFQLRRPQRL